MESQCKFCIHFHMKQIIDLKKCGFSLSLTCYYFADKKVFFSFLFDKKTTNAAKPRYNSFAILLLENLAIFSNV